MSYTPLTDEQIEEIASDNSLDTIHAVSRAIEAAATAPLLARIAELEAWRERIVSASKEAYGESCTRYKFSLTKSGKCLNTFPTEIDGRWFALTPAEDDGHIGHIARIVELEAALAEASKDAERYRFIRDADRSDCIKHEIGLYAMESLDEYIDAALEGEATVDTMKGTP